ncbi:MAG: cupredoxin domain-containing protein [Anaerolineae bacterium]
MSGSERWRSAAYALVVLVVLAAAVGLLWQALAGPRVAEAAGDGTIDVQAYMSGFSTYQIDAKVGESITIRLRSMDSSAHGDGGGKHQLAIDEFSVNIIAPPKGTAEFTFTPDRVGNFTFYCDVCCGGRANPTMRGLFVVSL